MASALAMHPVASSYGPRVSSTSRCRGQSNQEAGEGGGPREQGGGEVQDDKEGTGRMANPQGGMYLAGVGGGQDRTRISGGNNGVLHDKTRPSGS